MAAKPAQPGAPHLQLQGEGLALARRLPLLFAAARLVAASVMHGLHGRRRAGNGESFWQFRQHAPGESAQRIDWRRSARDDRLYVREREWEAAQDVWLWVDRSPSMNFSSAKALQSKGDRALVLGFAAAELLVSAGERVGLIDGAPPRAARDMVSRIALAMTHQDQATGAAEWPRAGSLPPRAQALLFTDGLIPAAALCAGLERLAGRGARGHVLLIADPVEESFPFSGQTVLLDTDSPARLRAGEAQDLRASYQARLLEHRAKINATALKLGWSCALHRTDQPAAAALMALAGRMAAMERM
ncbi:MAG: DUF58 domain-containing protein [Hyphomicrobiales bacterium]|nr:DUF58 domain-containing protein [Hyphomicrobiales bacterium]